jgi:hypothetical protein
VQFLSQNVQLLVKLVSFKFKKVIRIVKDDNHHFIFDFLKFDLTIVVKFGYLIELVSENVSVPDPIQINVKVHFVDSPFNEISHTFENKRCPSDSHWTINDVNHLGKVFDLFHKFINLSLATHDTRFDLFVSFQQFW